MKYFFHLVTITFFFAQSVYSEVVCDESSKGTALVVIDMQPVFVTRGGNHETPENKKKVNRILEEQRVLINKAKAAKIPIIFLEYEGDYGDTSQTLKSPVKGYSKVKTFMKNTDGMLSSYNSHRNGLIEFLKQQKIGKLIITGANGGACVESSIIDSLERNCSVVAYSPGIADFNYKDFIYPYSGHYSDIKTNCTNCTFRETDDKNEIFREIKSVDSNRNVNSNLNPNVNLHNRGENVTK